VAWVLTAGVKSWQWLQGRSSACVLTAEALQRERGDAAGKTRNGQTTRHGLMNNCRKRWDTPMRRSKQARPIVHHFIC